MKAIGPKLYKEQRHSGEIQKQDFKYMFQNPDGDIGFNPEYNRRIIEETIKKTKKREKELKKQYMEQVEERIDAGVSFLKALAEGRYNNPHTAAMKYFGRKELARLRGEEIKQELMAKIAMSGKFMNN